jgi:site-specific recombinase XerD
VHSRTLSGSRFVHKKFSPVNGDRLIRVTPWWNVDIVYKIVDDMPDRHTSGDLGTAIDVPKLPERLPKPLEAGDRDQLIAALPHDTLPELRDRALILLLLSTGARISKILRLDRSDWEPDRLWVLGKGDRERVVQVTDKARAAVEDYLTARKDHSPALFIGFQPASKAASSNRLTIAGAQHVCRQLARRLGIPAFHPHQLRHTLGTLLQETIGDTRLTAETLGHRGLGSVSGYTKITDQRRREAYEEMQRRGL